MMRYMFHPLAVVIGMSISLKAWSACPQPGESNVQLQILGSGGPDTVGRASASYLLWIDGESRIMVDSGGAAKHRFQQADARLDHLELVALSHLHPDHSVDLPALLWPEGGVLQSPDLRPQTIFHPLRAFSIDCSVRAALIACWRKRLICIPSR